MISYYLFYMLYYFVYNGRRFCMKCSFLSLYRTYRMRLLSFACFSLFDLIMMYGHCLPLHYLLFLLLFYILQTRPYWRCYFPNTQAIIYVVDSSDTDRLAIAKDEFHAILEVFPLVIYLLSELCSSRMHP